MSGCGQIVSVLARIITFTNSFSFLLTSFNFLVFTIQAKQDALFDSQENFQSIMVMMFGLSIYVIAISLYGIYSTFYASRNTVKVFGIMVILHIIVGGLIVWLTADRFDGMREMRENFKDKYQSKFSMDQYLWIEVEKNEATKAWDELQTNKHCCGYWSPGDWKDHKPKNLPAKALPVTCCKSSPTDAQYCDPTKQDYYKDGCLDAAFPPELDSCETNIYAMVISMFVLSVILVALSAIVICCRPSNSVEDYHVMN